MEKTNIELINNLTETIEFKELQSLGSKIHQEKRKFDLITVFEELLDEMAWSRLFAYLLDSTQTHELSQKVLRLILAKNSKTINFQKLLPSENQTESVCITEWETEKGRRIDILIKLIDKFGNVKAVIGIENKVDANEQNDQIRDYQKSLIHSFPNVPKVMFYLTLDGKFSETSDEKEECPYFTVSYINISSICSEIIQETSGQAQLFLSILKNHIDKITNTKVMDKEAIQHIKNLYKNREYREAFKLINEYSPNVKNVFQEIYNSEKFPSESSIDYHPRTSLNPNEFKVHFDELYEVTKATKLDPCYILKCENTNPDFEDRFTLRLAIWCPALKGKNASSQLIIREKIENAFSLPNSLGTNKHWSQWICIWTGNSYKLSDLGEEDKNRLEEILLSGINDTFEEFKNGLKKVAKMKF